ncbi:hypothetical protein ENKNEFLB_03987 [Nocardioides aquaticus]|uniref:Alpha/beta hydrolase n=1 Tax=Nocardioides aquaticus TaxID=160826 RepID=A0ABX8EN81_9ACTN|nr:hypothetical protein [Nocardioides aquaticus]QVT81577.1 hypothetical protein ENKNEFLB_03987 [Nocardioides aquaticus]
MTSEGRGAPRWPWAWTALGVLALVLAVGVVPLTTVAAGELPGRTVRTELEGQDVRLDLPGGDVDPKGLVVWFHGQGGDVDVRMDDPFLETLRRDGWAVASSDFHGPSWGNAASTRDVDLLEAWAEEQTGLTPDVFVAGSMGAATSLNALVEGTEPPACWYAVRPALSLTDMDAVPGADAYLRRAFGGAVPRTRDPIRNVDRLPTATHYRMVASRDDPWVDYTENAQPFIKELSAAGADVSQVLVYGDHQDDEHFNGRDVLAFANASCLD